MNRAIINYKKTMDSIKSNTQLQSSILQATNIINSPSYQKLFSSNILKKQSIEISSAFQKAIRQSNRISEVIQMNSNIFEEFKRNLGHAQDVFKILENIKIPDMETISDIINEHNIEKENEVELSSDTPIGDINAKAYQHEFGHLESEDDDISIKERVEYLTTTYFVPLWNAIVEVNKGTLSKTSGVTYELYLNDSDWFTFFAMINTIQFIIFMAYSKSKDEIEEKIK